MQVEGYFTCTDTLLNKQILIWNQWKSLCISGSIGFQLSLINLQLIRWFIGKLVDSIETELSGPKKIEVSPRNGNGSNQFGRLFAEWFMIFTQKTLYHLFHRDAPNRPCK